MDHSHYFKRTTVFNVEEDAISVVDVHKNNTLTPLDPWMGAVLSLADGQHTVAELISHMAAQYPNGAPENLTETLESVIEHLIEAKLVELTPHPSILPYYLQVPMDQQDQERATEMMINDGFLRSPDSDVS